MSITQGIVDQRAEIDNRFAGLAPVSKNPFKTVDSP
jgi:hypothetical protein